MGNHIHGLHNHGVVETNDVDDEDRKRRASFDRRNLRDESVDMGKQVAQTDDAALR